MNEEDTTPRRPTALPGLFSRVTARVPRLATDATSSKKWGLNYRQWVIDSRMTATGCVGTNEPFTANLLALCINNIRLCPLPSFYKLISSWPSCRLHMTVCATLLFSQLVAALGMKRSIARPTTYSGCYSQNLSILMAARSKAWVWGLSPAEIVGSNLARGINIFLLRVLCAVRQRSLRSLL